MSDHPLPNPSSGSPDWEAIARHLDGQGSPEEREAMERAIEAHPERARMLAELGRVVRAPLPAAPTSAEVELALSAVLARARAESAAPVTKVVPLNAYRLRGRTAAWRAAAAVIVVAGAALLWRYSPASRSKVDARAPQHFASAVGAMDSITLTDGTRVLLGPGSELTLAQGFGANAREVTLIGEARFDVHHDTARPFIVYTSAATFRDVGTVFSVHSDRTDGARIVVSEGAVAVQAIRRDSAVTLSRGDRAAVAPSGVLTVERSALAAEDTAWTTGRLLFRDATVGQVVADVRRWYGIDVRVDSALAGHHVSASFDRSSAPDVGRVLAALLGGGFRQEGSTLYIVPPAASAPR